MKFVTYQSESGPRAGLLVNGSVIDLAESGAVVGADLPTDLVGFLNLGDAGQAAAKKIVAGAEAGTITGKAESSVKLLPVIPNPPKMILLAGNYQSHIVEGGGAAVVKEHITPRPFIKPNTAIIGNGDPIVVPIDSDTVDYEIEIAAVIGKGGKHISLEDAADHILGYAVFNDISARQLKIADNRKARDGDSYFDWLLGKWPDSFAVLGPYLTTKDEAGDPLGLEMSLRVNGELRQHSSAGEMIFTIEETVAFMSRFITLQPGDLLCMGTPGGVGDTTGTYLRAGDVVTAEIDHLGKIENVIA